jgi:hypothetical protein
MDKCEVLVKIIMKKILWQSLRSFISLDTLTVVVMLLLFISGFLINFLSRPASSSFQIDEISFNLGENKRTIDVSISVSRGVIELYKVLINDFSLSSWHVDKFMINEGEKAHCLIEFPWKMGNTYVIKIITIDGNTAEIIAMAPSIEPSLSLNVRDLKGSLIPDLKIGLTYEVEGDGIDELHLIIFTFHSFKKSNRSIYVFYDPDYMANEALRRADFIIRYLESRSMKIHKLDFKSLEKFYDNTQNDILILINPLKDGWGRRLYDAAPAPLLDPNGNGYIRDDSRYGKSTLYDLMTDKGLILVTVGSHQPYKRILYGDGSYRLARDSDETFDAHLILTPANGNESIIKGAGFLGEYSPNRISGTLGLSYREEAFAFDRDALERYELSYYVYGEYKLHLKNSSLSLVLPIFIRVGNGGWLAMGDEGFWLSDEQLSHDLFLILLHSVWDSEWIPCGWHWDSGASFHRGGGIIKTSGLLETGGIPSNIVGEKVYVRVVGIAHSADLSRSIVVEKILEYRIP